MNAPGAAPDRTGTFRVEILIERTAEATRVVEFLSQPERLAVLYGRTNCGKTKLIRNFVIPKLTQRVFYGTTTPDLPALVTCGGASFPLREALASDAIVFLDEFDQLLAAGGKSRMDETSALLAALHRGEFAGKLAIILQEENLAHLLAFRSAAPSLLDNTFEIKGLPIEEHIQKLGEFGGQLALQYAPEVLQWLGRDLAEFGALGSGDIAEAVDWGFRQYKHSSPDRLVTAADYAEAGFLPGVIRHCLDARMQNAELRFGKGAGAITKAIAEEVVEAARANRPPAFQEIAPRLALPKPLLDGVLAWATNGGHFLRSDAKEGVGLIPRELARVLEAEIEVQWRELAEFRKILADGVRARKQLNSLLPKDRFDQVNRERERVKAGAEEIALLSLSALHFPEEHGEASYWLSRLLEREQQVDVLIEALFSESTTARLKAARLLAGFEDEEVRNQLYRKALEDPDAGVRERALDSLAGMDTQELWTRMEREARDPASPYRLNAVEAMRLCRGADFVASLHAIVEEPAAPPDLRASAIRSLGAIPTTEAVDTLVSLSLTREDEQDRAGAAAALAALKSPALLAQALQTVHATRLPMEDSGWEILRRPAEAAWRTMLAFALANLNFLFHGIALIPLRRPRWAAAFFAIELAAIFVLQSWILFVINGVASHFAATRFAMHGVGDRWWRFDITRILGGVFFFCAIPFVLVLHGAAHALLGRWKRAAYLFFMELGGIGLGLLAWYFFRDYGHGHHFVDRVFYGLFFAYLILGAAAYLWSCHLDIREAFYEDFLMSGRGVARQRKDALVGQALATSAGTQAALQLAESGDSSTARWARRILVGPPGDVSRQDLIVRLETLHDKAPPFLRSSLTRNKTDESVSALAALHDKTTSARLRSRILNALLSHPTQFSLREASKRLSGAGRLTYLRYHFTDATYGVRLLPTPVLWAAGLLLPFLAYALFEAKESAGNPAYGMIHHMRANLHRPQDAATGVKTALFLADVYPQQSAHEIIEIYQQSAATPAIHQGLVQSLELLACAGHKEASQEIREIRGHSHMVLRTMMSLAAQRPDCAEAANLLQHHGAIVLDNPGSPVEDVRLAIKGLAQASNPGSIEILRKFAIRERVAPRLRATDKALADQDNRRKEMELKIEAVDALVRIGPPAAAALDAVSKQALSSDVRSQVRQRLSADPLRGVEAAFHAADYARAVQEGEVVRPSTPRQQLALWSILGESHYRLSLEASKEAKELHEQSAIENFNRALQLDRNAEFTRSLAEIHNLRAERRRAANRLDEALVESDRALEVRPYFAEGYGTRGAILMARKDTDGALAAFARASSLDSKYAWAICMQADIALQRQDLDEAQRLSEQAIAADPNYSWSYFQLSQSYTRRKPERGQQAIERFQELERKHSSYYWPGRQLANLYHDHSSDPALGAERSYRKWAELDKNFASSLDAATLKNHRANFLESRFTTGRYSEVLKDGRGLAADLVNEPDLRIPVLLLTYAAALLENDSKAAREQLDTLELSLKPLGKNYKSLWDYGGTRAHIEKVKREPWGEAVIQLFDAAQKMKEQEGSLIPLDVIAANRKVL